MKLSSNQLFIVAIVAMALLALAAFLDRIYLPVLVSTLLGVLFLFTGSHSSASGAANVVQGLNLGVPLQPSASNPTPALGEQVKS